MKDNKLKGLKVECTICGVNLIREIQKHSASDRISDEKLCEMIRIHKTLYHDATICYVATKEEN